VDGSGDKNRSHEPSALPFAPNLRARLRAGLAWTRSVAEPPYVSAYTLDATAAQPKSFSVGSIRGLLHCEVVSGAAGGKTGLLYWSSKHAHDTGETAALAALGWKRSSALCGQAGDVVYAQGRAVSLWPTTIGDALIKGFAVVSAVVGLWGAGVALQGRLFGRVELVAATTPAVERVVAGRPFTVRREFVTRHGQGHVEVPAGRRPDGVVIAPLYAELRQGGSVAFSVTTQRDETGPTEIVLPLLATSGLLTPTSTVDQRIPIDVWPEFRTGALALEAFSGPTATVVSLTSRIDVGEAPAGLECSARGREIDRARFIAAIPAERDQSSPGESGPPGPNRAIKIAWRTGALPSFRTTPVRIILASDRAASPAEWTDVVARIKWRCGLP